MSRTNYVELYIGDMKADIDPQGQIPTISYQLEDADDFEQKKSADMLDMELPGTVVNDQIHNTLRNPSILDNTADQSFDNYRSMRYIGNGQEFFIGKYLPQSVIEQNGRPVRYKGKAYGLNGDWMVDMQEKTLQDFINPRQHTFDANTIIGSWNFDGRNEASDFLYAPVRYRKPFGDFQPESDDNPTGAPLDDNVLINDIKPSISIYWLLWRGFKSLGYRIVSQFMDTDYYRKSLLPWTWGGFDFMDDSRWEPWKFLAVQPYSQRFEGDQPDIYPDLQITIDGSIAPSAYINTPGLFTYTDGNSTLKFMMIWQYPTSPSNLNLGKVHIGFSVQISYAYKLQQGSEGNLQIYWYKNGIEVFNEYVWQDDSNPGVAQGKTASDFKTMFFETDMVPGDYVGVRMKIYLDERGTGGFARQDVKIEGYGIDFVKLSDGSTIDLKNNYPKFKNYKWLDLLRGEIDFFDLSINTDPIKKEVYIEPTHGYDINGTPYPGYFNREQIDWTQKVNLEKESELFLFSEYQRELEFFFKEDTNDGGLKKVQDRNQTVIGKAKYVLPERYKSEKKPFENRFYSPVMHYENKKFQYITGVAPQMIAIIPENIANTSSSESENIYNPKRVWYKGNVTGYGGWKFNGATYNTLPFMFAVNYKPGGENDPVLSYSDQKIGGLIAKGLMKKFFLQRMAILRNGRRYMPIEIMLNNYDVGNFLHRESIIIKDMEYILTSIKDYNPMTPGESTQCNMWMFMPVSTRDADNSYPSISSIQNTGITNSFDLKFWPHLLLTSDIPS
jgi:hypothetical protein